LREGIETKMILDKFKLDGRVALVTGAGSGMGQAIAIALAEAGADIVAVYRSQIDDTQQAVEALGRGFRPVRIDLAKATPFDLSELVDEAVMMMGALDILVNCAGVIDRIPAVDFPEDVWERTLHVNLTVPFFLSQAAARHFVPSGHGKIVNIGSILSYQGGVRVPAYAATKAAILNLTHELSDEWAGKGINVNCVLPGFMATAFTRPLQEDVKRASGILSRIPAGRWGTAEDVQGAVVFLASSASDYVYGAAIAVDGGWLAS
jgi:2-dehydro-3-deoxy-D-gluconate 5-dehydrogenase